MDMAIYCTLTAVLVWYGSAVTSQDATIKYSNNYKHTGKPNIYIPTNLHTYLVHVSFPAFMHAKRWTGTGWGVHYHWLHS